MRYLRQMCSKSASKPIVGKLISPSFWWYKNHFGQWALYGHVHCFFTAVSSFEYEPAINPKQRFSASGQCQSRGLFNYLSAKKNMPKLQCLTICRGKKNCTQNSKESSPLHYIFEQRAAGSFLLLKITHKLLLKWRDLKKMHLRTHRTSIFSI